MSAVILRRRKLGRKSTNGIANVSTTGIKVVRNWCDQWPGDYKYVFRWGCTSTIPDTDACVVNTAAAIHWCSDKRRGRLEMQDEGVPVPKTWEFGEFFDDMQSKEDGKYVVRPPQHAQGRGLYVIDVNTYGGGRKYHTGRIGAEVESGYVSELINKVAEYRVMVVCNRVVWVAQKTPGNPEDVAWNVARGGRFDNVRWGDWNLAVIRAALAAAKVSGCDFCGVDVMVDAEGNPYVLEVNSAPSQTSPYRQSCLAKAFDYIVNNGKEHFPAVQSNPRTTWKSYIHPAVRGEE